MPSKKLPASTKPKATKPRAETEPKFPYTTKPSSLRRFLQEIPKKPRPAKFDRALLRSWSFADANDHSVLRVLKAVDLLNEKNEPSELYAQYMHLQGGAAALAEPLRRIYAPLFQAAHQPYNESNEQLQNLFNIHSGGSDRTLEQQIQTFKALCENTIFDAKERPSATPSASSDTLPNPGTTATTAATSHTSVNGQLGSVNINVHIHLPENKARRDYECIIEDIGKYIFGRSDAQHRNE